MPQYGQVYPIAEDRNVDLPSIERELRNLWQGTAETRDEADAPVTRVCTLNLVAVAPDARSACRASEAGTSITARYPCRVIVATVDRSGSDALEASVSAYCHPAGASSKPICCERISLYASGKSVSQIAWAVTPLLAADVPVFVWLQGDPDPGDDLYTRLVAIADRLVVDLQSSARPDRLLPVLAAYTNASRPDVTDMAWRRTANWREMVATMFDPPSFRAYLGGLKDAEVGYVPGGAGWTQAQAALIGSWLCERLGWLPKGRFKRDGDSWTLKTTTGAGAGQLTLKPDARPGVAPGDLTSVVLPGSGGVRLCCERSHRPDMVELRIDRPDTDPLIWRQPIETPDTAWLLGQELERPHGSPAFEKVLALLATAI